MSKLLLLCAVALGVADEDADGDGLSDFHEVHKYFTNPNKADSDDDGIPDGDMNERREWTYSIRTVIRVMEPISEDALLDDFQDAWVRSRGKAGEYPYVELEVVHYPLNTTAEAIEGDDAWRRDANGRRQYVQPGPTTNWDEQMRRDLTAELREDGIIAEELDDRELVERASQWLMRRTERLNSSAYGILFDSDGKPSLIPGVEDGFRAIMWKRGGTIAEQFEHELYGRGMFYRRTTGSCTSAANYLATGLRAIGIPTRQVRAIPMVDASDPKQIEMARAGISLAPVREMILSELESLGQSFAAHTYNEVYVGGRWRRLNYDCLGQNTLVAGMGLLTHVQVYDDLASAGLGETWGRWNAAPEREATFPRSNPYRALEVSDRFGKHGPFDPKRPRTHTLLTIDRVYRPDDADVPDFIRNAGLPDDMLLGHVREWFAEIPDGDQIKLFTKAVDRDFVLHAEGHQDVPLEAAVGCISDARGSSREVLLRLKGSLKPGVTYQLQARNTVPGYRWEIAEDVLVVGK